MWLNIARQHDRQAAAVIKAISTAFSGAIPKEMLESLSEDSAEAQALYNRQQAAQAFQET